MVSYSRGWMTIGVNIYNAQGDSIIHRLYYDTLRTRYGKFIECYDIILNDLDTAFRQVFDLEGNLLRYEVFGQNGVVLAHYIYTYEDGNLTYSEFYEGDDFIYKEQITYYDDSHVRKIRISVPGDGMFSDLENSYTTEYFINEEGLLIQESDFLGDKMTSMTIYNYILFEEPEIEDEP